MNRSVFFRAAMLALAINCISCATIIKGSKQNVIILSEPKEATIEVDGDYLGETPFVARLKRSDKHVVRITLDGFEPYQMQITKKLNGWIFGNLLLGGLIGIAVDAATGSMYTLHPKDVNAELVAKANVQGKNVSGIYVTAVLKVDPSWKKIGQMER